MPLYNIRLHKYVGQTSTPTESGLQAASLASEVTGFPVVFDAAGRLTVGETNPTGVLGFSQADSNNAAAASTNIMYYTPKGDNVRYVGSVDIASAENTGTCVLTDVGSRYGLTKTSQTGTYEVNKWYIDKDKTDIAVQRVEITELVDPVDTIEGRVAFRLL